MTSAPTTAGTPDAPAAPRAPGFVRRLLQPVKALFTQGLSPARLAATLATGAVCSLFPFLGTTSLLNLAAGLALRMNHPALQALNQLLGPVQLAMILPYANLGAWLWGAPPQPFAPAAMVAAFADLPLSDFLARFGQLGLHAFAGWISTAPLLFAAVWLPARALARALERRRARPEVPR